MRRLASWSVRHRLLVVLLWVAAIAGLQGWATLAGTDYRNSFALPGTDSQAALDVLEEDFPQAAGDTDTLAIAVQQGSVLEPAVRDVVEPVVEEIAAAPNVVAVQSPYGPAGAMQVSPDGQTAFATVVYDAPAAEIPRESAERVLEIVESAETGDVVQLELGGQVVALLQGPETGAGELVGVLFAAVVLFLAFGSLLAMLLPLLSAAAALGVALGVVALLSNPIELNEFSPTVALILGLGVGIDYALFIVNRHRQGLRAGLPVEQSVVTALDTSGRAVVFAGITVAIALLGLLLVGIGFLVGFAVGATLAVLFTVLAAVTLLPALLGLLGTRVLSRRERRTLAEDGVVHGSGRTVWQRWADVVDRAPVVAGVVALAVLLAVAAPVLSLRLGVADQGSDPAGTTTREAYDLLAEGFGPGFNGPLLLTTPLSSQSDLAAFSELLQDLSADPGVAAVTPPQPSPDGTAALASVVPTTSPQAPETAELIALIRESLVPLAEEGTGLDVHVGGSTAIFEDFTDVIVDALPVFVGVVIGLSVLLLVLAFRSLLVPLVGALMNLVSVAAAFGVVTAVFQQGWASGLVGVSQTGPIEPFLPVILFAILFGLSMDYQVFLVSRMHEEWLRTGDNRRAVRVGHAETARVITAAATIMVFVFGSFIAGDSRVIKLFGLGLAAAVLLDAFLVRQVVVPALMHGIGRANWWLPRWLDRAMPHLSVEGDVAGASPEPARPAPRERERVPAGR